MIHATMKIRSDISITNPTIFCVDRVRAGPLLPGRPFFRFLDRDLRLSGVDVEAPRGFLSLYLPNTHHIASEWCHNGRDGVSDHQPRHCLLNRLFRRRSQKTSKPRVTGLCVGNSPVTCEFPAHMASNAENVSIWWCHNRWLDSKET